MIVYSFVVAVSAKRTRNKVLLVLFAVLFPAASGFVLYYFKGRREEEVLTDTPNS
ncbi:6-phosphofructokinase [Vibrio sp. TRT 17S01]|uniref:6-phosphofructokinase n=1 Tax=Vibrio sp. TRT 17S01 TaxID=3418505 RepID=UPI003CFBB5C2